MGIFSMFGSGKDMKAKVDEAKSNGASIIDVRERGEYAGGHIPGAKNVPLSVFQSSFAKTCPDKNAPVALYCASGARSSRAASAAKSMGYTNVTNLGGIMNYNGPLE